MFLIYLVYWITAATLSYLVFLTSLFYLNPSLIGIRPVQSFLQFQAKICLVTSFRDTCYVEIIPKDKNPTRGRYDFNILYKYHVLVWVFNLSLTILFIEFCYCYFLNNFRSLFYLFLWVYYFRCCLELWLSFWSEVHYNSLYATGGTSNYYICVIFLMSVTSSDCLTIASLFFGIFTDVPTRKPRKKYWLF